MFVLSACCSCKLFIWTNTCKEGDANATVHTGGACLTNKWCDSLHFLYFFSSRMPAPACLIQIVTTYAARCAFLAHFILWALHAFLPKISLLVAFILNYIHMLDIASWIKTVATIGLPRIKKPRICQEMAFPWLTVLSKIARQLSSPVWLTDQIPFIASLLMHSIK